MLTSSCGQVWREAGSDAHQESMLVAGSGETFIRPSIHPSDHTSIPPAGRLTVHPSPHLTVLPQAAWSTPWPTAAHHSTTACGTRAASSPPTPSPPESARC